MVLHFFDAATARQVMDGYIDAVAPGSYLVISCGSGDDVLAREYRARTVYNHSAETIAGWLAGLEALEPGLVDARTWAAAPDVSPPAPQRGQVLAVIARKSLTADTASSAKAGPHLVKVGPAPGCRLAASFRMACQPPRRDLAWWCPA
jgi:hypothetical protein